MIPGHFQQSSPTPVASASTVRSHHDNSRTNSQTYRSQQPRQTQQSSRASSSYGAASRPTTNSNGTRAHSNSGASRTSGSGSGSARVTRHEDRYAFSKLSSPAVPSSLWFAEDFMLGAGMVVIQPSSGKVVLLREVHQDQQGNRYARWFLPKGRKDVGESLEQAALREAHEESGFRVSFLPLLMTHNAPEPRTMDYHRLAPVTEPIFISTMHYGRGDGGRNNHGGQYLTFWYVGQIPDDAVVEANTRMADEVGYETFLLTIHEALRALESHPTHHHIVQTAHALWRDTVQIQGDPRYQRYMAEIARKDAELFPAAVPPDEPDEAAIPVVSSDDDADETGWVDSNSPTPPGLERGGVASQTGDVAAVETSAR